MVRLVVPGLRPMRAPVARLQNLAVEMYGVPKALAEGIVSMRDLRPSVVRLIPVVCSMIGCAVLIPKGIASSMPVITKAAMDLIIRP